MAVLIAGKEERLKTLKHKTTKTVTYKSDVSGYTGVMYGRSSLIIKDPSGREVMHTGRRAGHTLDWLMDVTDNYIAFSDMLLGKEETLEDYNEFRKEYEQNE